MMKNFLKKYIIFFFLINLVCMSINIVVDPFGLFYIAVKEEFNKNKPFQNDFEQIYKPMALYRYKPDTVILGSSIIQNAFDPKYIDRITGLRSFNAGIDGPTIYEVYKFFEFSLNNSSAKKFVVGLDFMMFLGSRGLHNSRFNLNRMESDLHSSKLRYFSISEAYQVFFSLRTLLKSYKTIKNQNQRSFYDKDGYRNSREIPADWELSYEVIFEDTRSAYAAFFSEAHDSYFSIRGKDSLFYYLRKMLSLAEIHNVEITFVITPNHQSFIEVLKDKKLIQLRNDWVSKVKSITREAIDKDGLNRVKVFDYTSDPRNNEEIPPGRTTQRMKYWIDAYHMSSKYGEEIAYEILAAKNI